MHKLIVEVSNARPSGYSDRSDAWDVDVTITGDIEERGEAAVYWDQANGQYSAIGTIDHAFSDHLVKLMGRLSRYDRGSLRQTIEVLAGYVIDDHYGAPAFDEIEVQYDS